MVLLVTLLLFIDSILGPFSGNNSKMLKAVPLSSYSQRVQLECNEFIGVSAFIQILTHI